MTAAFGVGLVCGATHETKAQKATRPPQKVLAPESELEAAQNAIEAQTEPDDLLGE